MELDEAIRLYEMNFDSQLVIHGKSAQNLKLQRYVRVINKRKSSYWLLLVKEFRL